jgi:hypothetical protein
LKKSLFVTALLAAAAASAYPCSNAEAASIGASVGYGTASGTPNAYDLGVLGRIGFTLPLDFYLGGTFVYHFGAEDNALTGTSSIKRKVWYTGGEFGYVIEIKKLSVRPYVGAGVIVLNINECDDGLCTSRSPNSFYLAPGVYSQYDFGPIYLGADIRYVAAANSDIPNSFGFFGSFGVNF